MRSAPRSSVLLRRLLTALSAAGLAAALAAPAEAGEGARGRGTASGPVKVPRRTRQAAAHRAYNQAKTAGLIVLGSGATSLPGNVKEAVSAGITDSNGQAGGFDQITLVHAGSGAHRQSYFAGNRYTGVATRKTSQTFEVHGPFRVDAQGTLEGAAPVVSATGVDRDALARETGVDVERESGGGERPSWFTGRANRTVVATGDDAVRQFHARHLDRSIHRTASARALNAVAAAGQLRGARLVRLSRSLGGAMVETVEVLTFRDKSGQRVRLIGP